MSLAYTASRIVSLFLSRCAYLPIQGFSSTFISKTGARLPKTGVSFYLDSHQLKKKPEEKIKIVQLIILRVI